MDKNWLIRTKSNHILGPISKEKVLELYHNGSIKPDDEICSGNGFWFFVREEDMVGTFLVGNDVQAFNPISEAKDVLTSSQSRMSDGDTADITLVGGLNLSMLKAPKKIEDAAPNGPDDSADPNSKKKNNFRINVKPSTNIDSYKPLNTQTYLKYLGIISFILLFLMVYYRKTIIHSLFQGEISSISLFGQAYAQEEKSSEKKKLLESSFKIEEIT